MSDDWPSDAFGSLLEIPTRNGVHKGPSHQGHGTPIVKMGEVYHEQIVGDAERDRFDLTPQELERFRLKDRDLLFCRTSLVAAGVGRCAIVGHLREDTAFASNLIRARLNPQKASASFYRYFFNSPIGRALMQSIARGTTVTTITGPDIAALRVPVPPLLRQREMAETLGVLDDKIELNRRMSRTLETIARAIFKSWFVDFDPVRKKMEGGEVGLPPDLAALFPASLVNSVLGEIPKGWRVTRLDGVILVNPGRSLRIGDIAPYLDMANMPTEGHTPDAVVDRAFGSGMRFVNGDTLVARITPCLENGKTAFVDFLADGQVGWGSTEYIVLRPAPPVPDYFAYCLARGSDFRELAIQSMTGSSGRQRVPATAVSHFKLALPVAPETLTAFGELTRPLVARATQVAEESRTLAALRDTLLPNMLSGELRVKDSDRAVDNPSA